MYKISATSQLTLHAWDNFGMTVLHWAPGTTILSQTCVINLFSFVGTAKFSQIWVIIAVPYIRKKNKSQFRVITVVPYVEKWDLFQTRNIPGSHVLRSNSPESGPKYYLEYLFVL